jgi:hypothetical protein
MIHFILGVRQNARRAASRATHPPPISLCPDLFLLTMTNLILE